MAQCCYKNAKYGGVEMRKQVMSFAIASVVLVADANASTNVINVVTQRLHALRAEMSPCWPTIGEVLNDWEECRIGEKSQFGAMRCVVTNSWPEIVARLSDISSNEVERLVILAAGVSGSEEEYLYRIDLLADGVSSNRITHAEIGFYRLRCSVENRSATSVLIRRYNVPAISNLIMKLSRVGYYPEGTSYIFSGEAKSLDESYDEAHR